MATESALAEARQLLAQFGKLVPRPHRKRVDSAGQSIEVLHEALELLRSLLGETSTADRERDRAARLVCSYRKKILKICAPLGAVPSEDHLYYDLILSMLRYTGAKCDLEPELHRRESQVEHLALLFSLEEGLVADEVLGRPARRTRKEEAPA